ncbi:hypothetical protein D9Q98_009122 [Chlorella vulgaris]|uniref:Uncharacterized protein n=1 Tax=Chlorella vulgaris TaxID=3077 RepID=A0A9D4THE0_CHLVU|nr:hypothetical protein D9Q98_009122 [Chlorella vulgaris]
MQAKTARIEALTERANSCCRPDVGSSKWCWEELPGCQVAGNRVNNAEANGAGSDVVVDVFWGAAALAWLVHIVAGGSGDGSEVWGMQLAAASAAGKTSSTAGSKAERLNLANLRRELGERQGTPTAVVLAEAGERPLWQPWLLRAVKL